MDGFNVLNTVAGGQCTGWSLVLIILSVVLAGIAVGIMFEAGPIGMLFLIPACLGFYGGNVAAQTITPTRYEITLKPGAVIDAARYQIVEQRGEIYVIQERKHP